MESYHKYHHFFTAPIQPEPFLAEENKRYSLMPLRHPAIFANYIAQTKKRWTPSEVDLSQDKKDWDERLTNDERYFIKNILGFFAGSDAVVNANISENMLKYFSPLEIIMCYQEQASVENIHNIQYNLFIDTYITDETEKLDLFNAIETNPAIKMKKEWCETWMKSDKPISLKIIAFAIMEGVFFSGAFAAIFWLKDRGILKGLLTGNHFIAPEESLHVALAVLIYALMKNKITQAIVYEMFDQAVEIEDMFINQSLPCKLLGMNSKLMSDYIRYVADILLVQLGCDRKYYTNMGLEYMGKIDVYAKENFFENKTHNYEEPQVNSRDWVMLDRVIEDD